MWGYCFYGAEVQWDIGPSSDQGGSYEEGVLEGYSGGCLGMTFLVLGSMVTGDCGFNISLVDPTILVSKTENLLV